MCDSVQAVTKRGRFRGRAIRLAVASSFVLAAVSPGVADAAQSVTNGTVKCTVTAVAPTLTLNKLSGYMNLVCTGATTVQVISTFVEMDGSTLSTEDPSWTVTKLSTWVVVSSSLANKVIKVPTTTVTCSDTDKLEKEEYATKAMLNLGGKTSAWDRTVPANNSFSC